MLRSSGRGGMGGIFGILEEGSDHLSVVWCWNDIQLINKGIKKDIAL